VSRFVRRRTDKVDCPRLRCSRFTDRRLMPITQTVRLTRRRSEEVREYLRGGEETRSCCDHVVEPAH